MELWQVATKGKRHGPLFRETVAEMVRSETVDDGVMV
jgi:hypothetical protein